MDVDSLIALRVRTLRRERELSLEQLAQRSGVSRSTISLIERRETSPTAAVLDKLADALGVSLPGLLAPDPRQAEPEPVARRADQPVWTDPASGYRRRHVSPPGVDSPIELVEVEFPAGQSVTFDNPSRSLVTHQQVWVLEGRMTIAAGDLRWRLEVGDCLALELGPRLVFENPDVRPARYLLALTTVAASPRRPA